MTDADTSRQFVRWDAVTQEEALAALDALVTDLRATESAAASSAANSDSRSLMFLEQAVASIRPVWEGERGQILLGDFSQSKVVNYFVGAKEWENLVRVCRRTGAADV